MMARTLSVGRAPSAAIARTTRRVRPAAAAWSLRVALAAAALAPAARVNAQVVVPSMHVTAGTLRFDAHATVGDFSGETRAVTGEVYATTVPGALHGWVEAPAQSLKTGIGRRDHHMRDALGADRYPVVRFEARTLEAAVRDDSASVRLSGTLTIHGVSRAVDVPLTATRSGDAVHVVGSFPVNANDYGISSGLVRFAGLLRVDPHMRIAVDLTFAPAPPMADGHR
jgi:polyisoprenoid-binding protein YceI